MEAAAMLKAVDSYMKGLTKADLDGVMALYAPNATVEDPVGTPVREGHEAIREFYAGAVAAGIKAELTGDVRCTESSAAFPFRLTVGDGAMKIAVIDVFEFNEDGKVISMKAYWGPENVL